MFARRSRPARNAAARLWVSQLEAREVPAMWTNLGGDHLAATAANWSYGWGESAGNMSSARFTAACSDDCVGLSGSFEAVELDDAYGGTVSTGGSLVADAVNVRGGVLSLNGTLTAKWLSQDAGTIDQPLGSVSEITVTQVWAWAGGTLNSTATPSSITVDGSAYGGATATLLPYGAIMTGAGQGPKTVYCGSNINLVNGATMTCRAGTLALLNSSLAINVFAAGLAIDPGSNENFVVSDGIEGLDAPKITLAGGVGWIEVRSGSFSFIGGMQNTGGRFTLFAGTSALLAGEFGQGNAYIQQNQGILELYGGSLLQTDGELEIDIQGGSVRTVAAPIGGAPDATIATKYFLFEGGEIVIGYNSVPNMPHRYGTLLILGDAGWDGGTFRPCVEGDLNWGMSDIWEVSGDLDVHRGTLTPLALDGESIPTSPITNGHWTVVRADKITTAVDVEYDQQVWLLSKNGVPDVTEWVLVGL